jgi:hypothetical protein
MKQEHCGYIPGGHDGVRFDGFDGFDVQTYRKKCHSVRYL